jgi:hypothetical protein
MNAKLACLNMLKTSRFPVRTKPVIEGLRLRATDADWTYGIGPEVAGPAVALMMAMATRPLVSSLTGDGVDTLRSRLQK